jgi:hypothetical protein
VKEQSIDEYQILESEKAEPLLALPVETGYSV